MSELSNLVFKTLQDLNLTPDDAAHKCGTSRETFYRSQRGESVRLTSLVQIADRLKLPETKKLELYAAWLRDKLGPEISNKMWIEPKEQSGQAKESATESQTASAADLFTRLTPPHRKAVLEIMRHPELLHAFGGVLTAIEKLQAK